MYRRCILYVIRFSSRIGQGCLVRSSSWSFVSFETLREKPKFCEGKLHERLIYLIYHPVQHPLHLLELDRRSLGFPANFAALDLPTVCTE
jgi:hypothetical protein